VGQFGDAAAFAFPFHNNLTEGEVNTVAEALAAAVTRSG
jgi:hypothetical protein